MSGPAAIDHVEARAYRIPTPQPEADGTLEWTATEMVLARVRADGACGLGYSYTHGRGAAALIEDVLGPRLIGANAIDVPASWRRLNQALRNIGRPGLGLMALAAVDIALWDLKARLLNLPLVTLWGRTRDRVPLYASGGFTSLGDSELREQLEGWAEAGFRAAKIKVGSQPDRDPYRVSAARQWIGADVDLMVDANGAYSQSQALQLGWLFADAGVCWFEEPVSSDDLETLHELRDRMPAGMAIAAGEYGWDGRYFRRMLEARAVDVLQVDATRCGYTGFLQAAALCESHGLPLSAHCAPAIHLPVCAAAPYLKHLEYFHDHQRLERLLFDGVPEPRDGALEASTEAHGHGLTLREDAARPYRIA